MFLEILTAFILEVTSLTLNRMANLYKFHFSLTSPRWLVENRNFYNCMEKFSFSLFDFSTH
jgi:hypothetical protein